jgi:adenylate kinase family enzyme
MGRNVVRCNGCNGVRQGSDPFTFTRVAVVGTSCSGKTTLARELAAIFACPHVELDALHWGPNWTSTPTEQLRPRVERALSGSAWVCDGNYAALRDIVWGRATELIWLNYTFPRVMGRAVKRTVHRICTQDPLYSGNRESFRQAFLSRDSILLWVVSSYGRRRRDYRELFDGTDYDHLRRIELRSVRESREFVNDLKRAALTDRT